RPGALLGDWSVPALLSRRRRRDRARERHRHPRHHAVHVHSLRDPAGRHGARDRALTMSRHSHGCGRGPCFAAGAAVLLATASSAASRERESVWYGVGLLAGATQLDPHLGDFQWDVRPRAAWGAEALAGRGRWTGGVRAWRATSTQTLGPSGTTSADVAVTTLEVLGQTRVASIAATDLLATANAGGLWLGYRPDQVTITPAGSS